jgi:ferrous iron transport protein A
MSLAETRIGTVVKVERVGGERSYRRRLMELGLVPGTRVEIVGVAPLGDPIEILVRGSSLSIRRAEARLIEVQRIESPAVASGARSDSRLTPATSAGLITASEARGTP